MRHRDGAMVWVRDEAALVTDAQGRVRWHGVMSDITDRKLVETSLRESEARYRLMAENSTDLISRTTARGVFVYASDAIRSLLGYEPSEVMGHSVLEYIEPEDHHLVRHYTRGLELGNKWPLKGPLVAYLVSPVGKIAAAPTPGSLP